MLNPASKTFSIRRLQGMCKSGHGGISFVPPSAPRAAPRPAIRAADPSASNSIIAGPAWDMSQGFVNMASSAASQTSVCARVATNAAARAGAGWGRDVAYAQ